MSNWGLHKFHKWIWPWPRTFKCALNNDCRVFYCVLCFEYCYLTVLTNHFSYVCCLTNPVVIHCVCVSPNSITPTFTKTSPREKSPTQITKVANTNHLDMSRCLRQSPWQVHDKPVCVALMEFSPLQCTGKVGDKVRDTNHEIYVRDFVANLSWTLSQSRCNGIWVVTDRQTNGGTIM